MIYYIFILYFNYTTEYVIWRPKHSRLSSMKIVWQVTLITILYWITHLNGKSKLQNKGNFGLCIFHFLGFKVCTWQQKSRGNKSSKAFSLFFTFIIKRVNVPGAAAGVFSPCTPYIWYECEAFLAAYMQQTIYMSHNKMVNNDQSNISIKQSIMCVDVPVVILPK